MLNFSFINPTKIHFGKGQVSQVAQDIPEGACILLTYGGGSIKKNGTFDQVVAALENYFVVEFGGIEPNPTYETLMQAVELARQEKIDYLLAVGGGSVIDGTKFIAAAIPFEGDPWTILSEGAEIKAAVPLGCVLTLPATGSESNANSVVTLKETSDKLSFSHPLVYPVFAVLDPETTYSLPARQTANGIVDAYVHIMEQYLTCRSGAQVQDRYSEGLLLTLLEEGPKVLERPDNYELRATIMWAANQALNGLIGVGVPQDWATHMIGHEITALYGLDHAVTLAIVLPSLMNEMRHEKKAKLLQYAERVWNITEGSEDQRIDLAINNTRGFFEQVGIKTRLGDYGIGDEAVGKLLAQLERHGMKKLGETSMVTLERSSRILTNAL